MEKIRTTVRIAGKDYTMSGYDSENYMRRVAIFVDRKISELSMVTRMNVQDSAVLTVIFSCAHFSINRAAISQGTFIGTTPLSFFFSIIAENWEKIKRKGNASFKK